MKFVVTSFLILTACLHSNKSWSQSFELSDITFQEGDILINNSIIFEFARASLIKDSTVFLDSLVSFCNTNSNLTIEIGYHRDSRGSDHYSYDLTSARAKTIRTYLTQHGIPEQQVSAKGYGQTKLLVSDRDITKLKTQEEKEKAHQKNRRVEIIILKID